MIRKKWWTITYYYNNTKDWIGKSPFDSRIHVNNIDDRVIDRDSAYRYAELIKGKRDLYYFVERGKHK